MSYAIPLADPHDAGAPPVPLGRVPRARASGQLDYPAMNIADGNLTTFASTGGTETGGPVPIHTITMTIKNPIKISFR